MRQTVGVMSHKQCTRLGNKICSMPVFFVSSDPIFRRPALLCGRQRKRNIVVTGKIITLANPQSAKSCPLPDHINVRLLIFTETCDFFVSRQWLMVALVSLEEFYTKAKSSQCCIGRNFVTLKGHLFHLIWWKIEKKMKMKNSPTLFGLPTREVN